MEIGDFLDNITRSFKEFADLKSDAVKLMLVENISLLSSDMLSGVVVFIILTAAFFIALVAVIILLAHYIGFLYGTLVVCTILIFTALIVYLLRRRLFANIFVPRFSKMFFSDESDKKEPELFENKEY